MKNRTKLRFFGAIVLVIGLIFGAVGCSSDNTTQKSAVEDGLGKLNNDIDGGKLVERKEVDGGRLTVVTIYSTDYPVGSWQITKSKTLNFQVALETGKGGEGAQVYVEHVHADVSLLSSKNGLDGIKQDSMDDSMHSGPDPGFSISDGFPYQGIFVIEGYSDTLISGWGYQYGEFGQSAISEQRLTEKNLIKAGVKGNKISFVYDLVIKYPGATGFHKVAVRSEFIVPVKSLQKN